MTTSSSSITVQKMILALLFAHCAVTQPVTAQPWPNGCGLGGPSPCGDKPCLPRFPHTYLMQQSTIFMPCNYSGHYNPQVAAKFGIVDFDWSNEKDEWINDSPMTCKERLLEQARVIKAINNETKVWSSVPRVCGSTAVVH